MAPQTHHHRSILAPCPEGSRMSRASLTARAALLLAAIAAATSLMLSAVPLPRRALAAEPLTIHVRKAWADERGIEIAAPKGIQAIDLELMSYTGDDPSAAEPMGAFITLSDRNGWRGSVDGLAATDGQGRELRYTVREPDVPIPYEVRSIEGSGMSEDDPIVVTNAPAVTSLTVTKIWKDASDARGLRPEETTLTLANDKGLDASAYAPTWVKEGDAWHATFSGMPKYAADGSEVAWTVTEAPVEGYAATYSSGDHAEDGGTITNSLDVPEEPAPEPDPESEAPDAPKPAENPEPEPEAPQPQRVAATQEALPQTSDDASPAPPVLAAIGASCLAAGVVRHLHRGRQGRA